MTIDDNRQKAGRNSFCCCLKNKAFLEEVRGHINTIVFHDLAHIAMFLFISIGTQTTTSIWNRGARGIKQADPSRPFVMLFSLFCNPSKRGFKEVWFFRLSQNLWNRIARPQAGSTRSCTSLDSSGGNSKFGSKNMFMFLRKAPETVRIQVWPL